MALTEEQIADNKRRNDEWDARVSEARRTVYNRRLAACNEFNAAHADDTSDDYFIAELDKRWLIMGGGHGKVTPWDIEYRSYSTKSSANRKLKQYLADESRPGYGNCHMCGMNLAEQAAEDFCGIKSINCNARRRFPNKYKGTTDEGLPHIQTMNGLTSIGFGRMGVYTVNSLVTPDGDVPVSQEQVRELKGMGRGTKDN